MIINGEKKNLGPMMVLSNFDIDLQFGKIYEEKVRDIFEGDGSIEVKTERDIWVTTGNMVLEIRHNGKLSGLSSTNAKWWMHVFTSDGDIKFAIMFKVETLKKYVKKLIGMNMAKIVTGGDDDKSELVLVPVKYVVSKAWI
jgi:hypothetical protein